MLARLDGAVAVLTDRDGEFDYSSQKHFQRRTRRAPGWIVAGIHCGRERFFYLSASVT